MNRKRNGGLYDLFRDFLFDDMNSCYKEIGCIPI